MENKAQDKKEDKLILGGHEFNSRFILGSGKYNVNLIKAAVEQGGAEIITLALRRANTENKENILDFIPKGVTLLPNTSGARNAEEAVRTNHLKSSHKSCQPSAHLSPLFLRKPFYRNLHFHTVFYRASTQSSSGGRKSLVQIELSAI